MSTIVVIEDNETMREGMVRVLKKMGHQVFDAVDGLRGLNYLSGGKVDVVITDYKLEGMDGLEVLKRVKKMAQETEVMIITAYGTIELAVEAMKEGAADFITKPFSPEELKIKVERILERIREREEMGRIAEENIYLRDELDIRFNYGEIVGDSPKMKEVYRTIRKVAETDSSVLIYGESGTGKELVARAIHKNSKRRNGPFIRLNCGVLAEGVLESELFGHEKGAFTGALRRKKGRFELAHQGTLFLDEIGDIPLSTQIKLLRVLQEKEFERVGGEETVHVDVRVIAATNKKLLEEVARGNFREDLFYRLHIIPIELPPLRERKEDIPLLAQHFLAKIGEELGKPHVMIDDKAMEAFLEYTWPGNVRELENVIERALVLSDGDTIQIDDLPLMVKGAGMEGRIAVPGESLQLDKTVEDVERQLIERAMAKAKGIKTEAAKILGIKPSTLYYKLEKYGMM